jgi:hypothetical protein
MFKMASCDSFGHLKHKLWQKKGQESNYQLSIALISLCVGGMSQIVGKLLTRATTFL